MLWLPSKRREEGPKDMDGGQGQMDKSGWGGLFQLWQFPQLHRVFNRAQLAFRSSQINTAGPLFGTKSLFNVRLFWNVWYFIKYSKSTKGRQKKIPHCNIYILRAWSPGSGLYDGAWEWKRQRGNIRITLWDRRAINRKTPPLAVWLAEELPLGHALCTYNIFTHHCSLPHDTSCHHNKQSTHEASGVPWQLPGGFPLITTEMQCEMCQREPTSVSTCVSSLMAAQNRFPKGIPVGIWLILFAFLHTTLPKPPHSFPPVPQQHTTSGSGKVEEMSRKLITCSDYLSVSGEFPLLPLFGNCSHP